MTELFLEQTATLERIHFENPPRINWDNRYSHLNQSSIPAQIPQNINMDNAFSPPLSQIEIADIEANLRAPSEETKTYDDVERFIKDLRAERKRFRRQVRT